MTTQSLERTVMTRLQNILPNGEDRTARTARLLLRVALYLIAHDDTGRARRDEDRLGLGLAAAILLDLWLAGRIYIGWREDARQGVLVKDPGMVRVRDAKPIGDPLSDNLLAVLWHAGGALRLADVMKQFAATNLYERVRADMIAAGILARSTRRRFWFSRTDVYLPTHKAYPVRARAIVRDLVDNYRLNPHKQPDYRGLALSALVTALGLGRYLYAPDDRTTQFHRWLSYIADQLTGSTIRDVVRAATGRW